MYNTCTALFPPGLSAGTSAQTVTLPALWVSRAKAFSRVEAVQTCYRRLCPCWFFCFPIEKKRHVKELNLLLWVFSSVKNTRAFQHIGRCRDLVLKQSPVSHFSCPASSPPLLGSARFPPSAPLKPFWMAAQWLRYSKQVEISKPNRLAEAVPLHQ